jgi:hypothetical protein
MVCRWLGLFVLSPCTCGTIGNEEPRFIEVYAPVNLFKCMLMLFFLIYEQGAVNDGDEQQEQVG